jgi:hypothetical protein
VKHNKPRVHALYRLVQYENCFTVYRDIIRSYDDKYEMHVEEDKLVHRDSPAD